MIEDMDSIGLEGHLGCDLGVRYLYMLEKGMYTKAMLRGIFIVISLLICIGVCAEQDAAHPSATVIEPAMLIGCWQDSPNPTDGLRDCFNFYEDGTCRFIYNEMAPFERRRYLDGTWTFSDDEMVISFTTLTSQEGGVLEHRHHTGIYSPGRANG